METNSDLLRFNHSPQTVLMSDKRKQGLRVGAIGSALQGFYQNCLATGVSYRQLGELLSRHLNFKDVPAAQESFHFLLNEGERVTYQILLPHLLYTHSLEELQSSIEERFLGIQQFVHYACNLYQFIDYAGSQKVVSFTQNDLRLGILGWDMGHLVTLARAACETGYITEKQAWQYVEQAGRFCSKTLIDASAADKSFLLGEAMNTGKIEDWERMLKCYLLVKEQY